MRRSKMTSVIAVMTLLQSMAHAQMDLPDPGMDLSAGATPAPSVSTSTEAQYAGSVSITSISRKTGGALYTVQLAKPVSLKRLDLRVSVSRVKLYSVTLVAESGQRVQVSQLSNTAVLDTGAALSSEALNAGLKISSIEVQAESYSAEANIVLIALSGVETPSLSLNVAAAVDPSLTPAPNTTTDGSITTPETVRANNPGLNIPTENPGGYLPPVGLPAAFMPGDLALYNGSQLVRVVSIRGDQVEITLDGRRTFMVYASILEKSVTCSASFCQNDTVVYGNQYGQVQTVFVSGKLIVALSGQSYILDSYQVSRVQSGGINQPGSHTSYQMCDQLNRICNGDMVLYQSDYVGRVVRVLDRDTAEISLNGFSQTFTVFIDQLATSSECSASRVCRGQKAFYQGVLVDVTGIFSNGMASVRYDRGSSDTIVVASSLSLSPAGPRPGLSQGVQFSVGQRVKYRGRTVTIREIYADGRARISSGTLFGNDSVVYLSELNR